MVKYHLLIFIFIAFVLSSSKSGFSQSIQSEDLNSYIIKSLQKGNKEIQIPEGEYIVNKPIVINQSGVSIVGIGNVVIKSRIKDKDSAVLWFRGNQGKKNGYSLNSLKKGEKTIYLSKFLNPFDNIKFVLIRYPNTEDFFEKIGSKVWRKEYPYLRQGIYEVESINANRITLKEEVEIDYPENTEIWAVNLLENITVKNLTVVQEIPNTNKEEVKYVYENMYPEYTVDAIRMEYTANSKVENIKVKMVGRHVFNCEFCYKIYVNNFEGNGSWNKGKNGNGYFKVSKTFNSYFSNIKLEDIRHLTIQWMSAKNVFTNLYLKVDINFHGGYTRYN